MKRDIYFLDEMTFKTILLIDSDLGGTVNYYYSVTIV